MSIFFTFDHQKLIVAAPPRTASRSLKAAWLTYEGESDEDLSIAAPTPVKRVLDLKDEGYYVVALVRNPFTRIESTWKAKVAGLASDRISTADDAEYTLKGLDLPFDSFLLAVRDIKRGNLDGHLATQVSQLTYDDVFLPDEIIKFEDVFTDWVDLMVRFPGIPRLPHRNRTFPVEPRVWTPKMRNIVAKVYRDDFAKFGYDPKALDL